MSVPSCKITNAIGADQFLRSLFRVTNRDPDQEHEDDVKGLSSRGDSARDLASRIRCALRRPVLRCPSKKRNLFFVLERGSVLRS